MSVGNNEKWILVEWGNCTRGIVHSRYLVDVDNRELQAGCSVIISRRGEQQIATFLARSNERQLLEEILKQSDAAEQGGAGPSAPAPPEDEEPFSGSASSWAPSDDDASDSSEPEDDKIEEQPKPMELVPPEEEETPRKRNTKKVLTPSNRVNAIIPNSMQKSASKKGKRMNLGKENNIRKRKHAEVDKENVEVIIPPVKEDEVRPKTVSLNLNVDDILLMKNMFKELFKIIRNVKRLYTNGATEKEIMVPNMEHVENVLVATVPDDAENEMDKSRSEDLNRSDDNVLITNKYDNIENNTRNTTENQDKGDVYDIQNETANDEWVPIGSGKTLIHKDKFRKIKWTSYTMATRGLLLAVFPRRVLATHSLTGKRSPAFQNKPAKMCLDPKKVSDIVIEVMDRFRVRENLIRSIITTKCADEGKMFRMRMEKKKKLLPKNQGILVQNMEQPPEEHS